MKISPLLQINIFLCMLFGGLFAYLIYFLINLFLFKIINKKNNKILQIIFNIFNIFLLFFIFLLFLNIFHFGTFRFSLIFIFILGFVWAYITFKNTLAFLSHKLYNAFISFINEYKIFKSGKNGSISD